MKCIRKRSLISILLVLCMLLSGVTVLADTQPARDISLSSFTRPISLTASVTANTLYELGSYLQQSGSLVIKIGADIDEEIDGSLVWCAVNGTKTIDLNGHTVAIYSKSTSSQVLFYIGSGVSLTVKGDGIIQFNGKDKDEYPPHILSIFGVQGGSLTVNGGTYIAGHFRWKYNTVLADETRYVIGTPVYVESGTANLWGGTYYGGYDDNGAVLVTDGKGAELNVYGGSYYGVNEGTCVKCNAGSLNVYQGTFKNILDMTNLNQAGNNKTGLTSAMLDDSASSWTISANAQTVSVSARPLSLQSLKIGSVRLYGTGFDLQLEADTGVGPITWSVVSGSLPYGISLSEAGHMTGKFQSVNTYTFTLRATDAYGNYKDAQFTMDIISQQADTYSYETLNFITGQDVSTGTGYSVYSLDYDDHNYQSASIYLVQGSLPSGVTWSWGVGQAYLKGTPTEAGTYSAKFKIVQGDDYSTLYHYVTIYVYGQTDNTSESIEMPVNVESSRTYLNVDNHGDEPNSITLSGSLPAGVTWGWNAAELWVVGTPTKAGTYQVVFTVVRADNTAEKHTVNIEVTEKKPLFVSLTDVTTIDFVGPTDDGTGTVELGDPIKKGDTTTGTTTGTSTGSGTSTVTDPNYVFPFIDVMASDWFFPYVEGAHKMGLINGKSATTFCPNDNMTYAEAIKLAACMNQLYTTGTVTLTNGSPWYSTYVDYCLDKGIITQDYAAVITSPIDRQNYVQIFVNSLPAAAFTSINTIPNNSLPDVSINNPCYTAIYTFYRAGIVNGTDAKGTFNPTENIQRSQVAAILIRMMDASYRVGAPEELG